MNSTVCKPEQLNFDFKLFSVAEVNETPTVKITLNIGIYVVKTPIFHLTTHCHKTGPRMMYLKEVKSHSSNNVCGLSTVAI